jgi:hypothetical protein
MAVREWTLRTSLRVVRVREGGDVGVKGGLRVLVQVLCVKKMMYLQCVEAKQSGCGT